MTPEEIEALSTTMAAVVREHVDAATRPLLERIATLEAREPRKGDKGDKGDRGDAGEPGKDGEPGKPGERGDRGEPGLNGEKGDTGTEGPPGKDGRDGKDGLGLAGALIDRGGNLVVTLTDGTTRELGAVVGKDGDKGEPGRDGKDGADGVGFDDLEVVHDGARGFTFRFVKGDRVKEFAFSLPVVLDCGVFKEGSEYHAGDGVTWGGSFWIAQENTAEKPDSGKGWRLAVKRGRDGKDGVLKAERPNEPIRVGIPTRAS